MTRALEPVLVGEHDTHLQAPRKALHDGRCLRNLSFRQKVTVSSPTSGSGPRLPVAENGGTFLHRRGRRLLQQPQGARGIWSALRAIVGNTDANRPRLSRRRQRRFAQPFDPPAAAGN